MSQMPDKIWLHKDTKYSTGDIVCGYQYDFVQGIEDEGGIENFVEYVPADAFIKKACEFMETYPHMFMGKMRGEMIEQFKKYMEDNV